jgi:hypothetical protein
MFNFSVCKEVFGEIDQDIQDFLLPTDHFDANFTFGDILKDYDKVSEEIKDLSLEYRAMNRDLLAKLSFLQFRKGVCMSPCVLTRHLLLLMKLPMQFFTKNPKGNQIRIYLSLI